MKKSTFNAEHYNWGQGCDGWHLLKSPSLSVIEERMPPGSSEQEHYHSHCQQLFYVLSGSAQFEIDGSIVEVNVHESIHIPAGIRHRIFNASPTDLRFLVISEPPSHGDRINVS